MRQSLPLAGVWKLVLVRAGRAPESLLDTYHDERHPAALENLRLTDDTMRFLVPRSGLARWKRDAILPFKFMRRSVNAGHMSNPFTYQGSPIISEDPQLLAASRPGKLPPEQRAALERFRLGPVVGALAPAVMLADARSGEPVPLLDCFGRSFVVLYFCSDADAGLAALQRVRANLPSIPVALYLVAAGLPASMDIDGVCCTLLDVEGKGATTYNAASRTLYLMRPDRHIAARRFDSDLSELPTLLRRAVGFAVKTGY